MVENNKYIKVGHTIYKPFFIVGLYGCCIFDYSLLYGNLNKVLYMRNLEDGKKMGVS